MLFAYLLAAAAFLVLPVVFRFAERDVPGRPVEHEDDPPDTAGLARDRTVTLAVA